MVTGVDDIFQNEVFLFSFSFKCINHLYSIAYIFSSSSDTPLFYAQDPSIPVVDIFLTTAISKQGKRCQYRVRDLPGSPLAKKYGEDELERIITEIREYYDDVDSFVITVPIEAIPSFACLLSFSLKNLSKPIIFTTAVSSLASQSSRQPTDNLLGALLCAGHIPTADVMVFHDRKLLRGNRVYKEASSIAISAFRSTIGSLAVVGDFIDISKTFLLSIPEDPVSSFDLEFTPKLCKDVIVISLLPEMPAMLVSNILAPPLRGAVLNLSSFPSVSDVSAEVVAAIQNASSRGVIVLVINIVGQTVAESAKNLFEAPLYDAGVIHGFDLTSDAALAKLGICLSQSNNAYEVTDLMSSSIRGEMTVQPGYKTAMIDRGPAEVDDEEVEDSSTSNGENKSTVKLLEEDSKEAKPLLLAGSQDAGDVQSETQTELKNSSIVEQQSDTKITAKEETGDLESSSPTESNSEQLLSSTLSVGDISNAAVSNLDDRDLSGTLKAHEVVTKSQRKSRHRRRSSQGRKLSAASNLSQEAKDDLVKISAGGSTFDKPTKASLSRTNSIRKERSRSRSTSNANKR